MFIRHVAAWCAAALLMLSPGPLSAQKDYYNTDRNRPVRVEDAYPTERYAFEIKLAPLRLERETGGLYHWGFHPEIAYGILPRTSVEVGMPVLLVDGGGAGRRSGLAGIELSVFHNLNIETRTLPALGLRADLALPVGPLSGDRARPALTGIATRTFTWARLHANAQYTFGTAGTTDPAADGAHEPPRWLAGLAIDRAFPLSSLLLIGDVYASRPIHDEESTDWHAGAGLRYQLSPWIAMDAGVGRRLTGPPAWHITFGAAWHFGVRSLIPR